MISVGLGWSRLVSKGLSQLMGWMGWMDLRVGGLEHVKDGCSTWTGLDWMDGSPGGVRFRAPLGC